MRYSARFLRTALTGAMLCTSLALTASALTYGVGTITCGSLLLYAEEDTDAVEKAAVSEPEKQAAGWYTANLKGTANNIADESSDAAGEETDQDADATDTDTADAADTDAADAADADAADDDAASSADTTAAAESESDDDLGTGVLNTGGASLYLRSGPGTSYDKLASVPAGTALALIGSENGWYKTTYNGVTGYVCSDYIVLSDTAVPTTTTASTTTATTTTTTAASTTTSTTTSSASTATTSTASAASAESTAASETTATTSDTSLGEQIVAYAKQFLGCSYVYGAAGPSSFDCSGFTSYVYKHFGYSLNRTASDQYNNGTVISESEMQPGDLILWRAYGSSKTATHVGIYIGNNQYIHASSTSGCVTISTLDECSSARYIVGVRRIAS